MVGPLSREGGAAGGARAAVSSGCGWARGGKDASYPLAIDFGGARVGAGTPRWGRVRGRQG